MAGKSMTSFNFSARGLRLGLVGATALSLAACDENGEFSLGALGSGNAGAESAVEAAPAGQSVQLVERDVEAPEVFQVSEAGLWDGRPSLGGVWVAHPDVAEPERVIIRNTSNGNFVIGALFRRERENPGPRLQVSSDAAAALGLLAGSPAELQVTALRREEVSEPTATATTDFDEPTEVTATALDDAPAEGVDAPEADPIAGAAAAIEAAETATPSPAPATPPSAAPASSLSKPYIQLGIFSVEDNATRTADRMRANGIVPTVLQQESQGRTFWRVIVGPATSESERAQILEQVKGMGFTDAYFVSN